MIVSSTMTVGSTLENSLRHQIEEIARRNSEHKKYAQVEDRTKEMDDIVIRLRQLIVDNPTKAVHLHLKAISILDETDRLIVATMPETKPINPLIRQKQSSLLRHNWRTHASNKIMPEKITTTMRFTTFADDCAMDDDDAVGNYSLSENNAEEYTSVIVSEDKSAEEPGAPTSTSPSDWNSGRWYQFLLCGRAEANNQSDNDVRSLWKTQTEFFLSMLGFMVGVGNMLKFPSYAYEYGGVFLIPYFVFLVLFGLPLVYMHLCIGQYSGLSASGAFWKLMPLSSGIGWALVLLALPVSIYYNIIVAWAIYYFWFAIKGIFTGLLPWNKCNPKWPKNIACCLINGPPECYSQPHSISSAEAFFHYEVLNRTAKFYPTINQTFDNVTLLEQSPEFYNNILDPALGQVQSHLVLSLAFAWMFVILGVFKGIGSIGWTVSITSTLPFLLLCILLLRGISLPGASQGLIFLFKPDIEKIWSMQMWRAAAELVFYSLGIDAGPLISMASFSRYRNNIYRDAVAVVFINAFTSVLSGMVIFSFVGFLSQNEHRPIDAILKRDPLYIAFTIYPGVTTFMDSMGPFWAAAFFAMITMSAVDAEFAWIEMIVSSMMTQLGEANRRIETRLVVTLCVFCFLCGLPLTTRVGFEIINGIYIFHAIEDLNADWNSFLLSFLQIVVICYFYGVKNFIDDIGEMLRKPKNLAEKIKSLNSKCKQLTRYEQLKFFFGPTGGYIRWTWSFFSPFILLFLLVASIFQYERVTLESYPIPFHFELIAWLAMLGPLIVVPLVAMFAVRDAWKTRTSIGDPVSRVASARRPNASLVDDAGYETMVEMISEWAKKNASTLGDRLVISNEWKDKSHSGTDLSEKFPQASSNWVGVHGKDNNELTLFGAPPTVEILEKTNTVIYRPIKGGRYGLNPLSSNVQAGCSRSKHQIAQPSHIMQSDGFNERTNAKHSLMRRSRSVEEFQQLRYGKSEVASARMSSQPSLMSCPSSPKLCHRREHHSIDCRSLGSISITPVDLASSTVPSESNLSYTECYERLPSLRRPEPINAPSTPFKRL